MKASFEFATKGGCSDDLDGELPDGEYDREERTSQAYGVSAAVHRGRRPYRAPMGLPRGLSLLDRMATNLAARMHRPRGTIVLYIEAIDLKRNTLYSVPLTNHPPQQPNRARAIFQQYLGRIRPCTRIKTGYPWAACERYANTRPG